MEGWRWLRHETEIYDVAAKHCKRLDFCSALKGLQVCHLIRPASQCLSLKFTNLGSIWTKSDSLLINLTGSEDWKARGRQTWVAEVSKNV